MSAYYKQVVNSQLVVVNKAELKIREQRRDVEVQLPQDASRGPTRDSRDGNPQRLGVEP